MLARVSGGKGGIREYLEKGQKQGREFSRDELDARVVLDGDLELTDQIIQSMDGDGEKYLHITLAFKEDELAPELMAAIISEFEYFAFSAYEPDEYNFYAEAHLPKIKSYINKKTGEIVERKPHIHIVAPERNLLTGQLLNPFGLVEQNQSFIDAFQEYINNKYGLASPKDNRRTEFTDASEMLSRYKGDIFNGHDKSLKERLLSELLERDITTMDGFQEMATEYGAVRVRNQGKSGEYLNIKAPGAAKGTNLKDFVFSREFVELSTDEKRRRLEIDARHHYETTGEARATPDELLAKLDDWHERRAREIKYLNSGNRKLWRAYQEAEPEEKARLLAEREAAFYNKHRKERDDDGADNGGPLERIGENLRAADDHLQSASRAAGNLDRAGWRVIDRSAHSAVAAAFERCIGNQNNPPVVERDGGADREVDNVIGQRAYDLAEQQRLDKAAEREELATIKRELDASRLLAALAVSHGLIQEKYAIAKGKDGGDRIRCGTRNLNVSDFLTKEMNIPWRDAGHVLRDVYRQQIEQKPARQPRQAPRHALWQEYREWRQDQPSSADLWAAQRVSERERREAITSTFRAARARLQQDQALVPAERRAALSVARMERVVAEQTLRATILIEREALKARVRRPDADLYLDFLAATAQAGDERALAELRRMQTAPTAKKPAAGRLSSGAVVAAAPEEEPIYRRAAMSYIVHRTGAVTYERNGRSVVRDDGRFVAVLEADVDTIETALRLAQQKFGSTLQVDGSDDFKRQVAMVAAERRLNVRFTDERLNDLVHPRAPRSTANEKAAVNRALATVLTADTLETIARVATQPRTETQDEREDEGPTPS